MIVKQLLLRACVIAIPTLALTVIPDSASAQLRKPPVTPAKPAQPVKPTKPVKRVKKDPKWAVELFIGGAAGPAPSGSRPIQFPVGTTFLTETEARFPSRANSSWYFGDGSNLFNEVRTQFASQFNVQLPRIEPLDGMLSAAALRRGPARSFGLRLSRRLTPRYELEFGFHRTQGELGLRDSAAAAIEAARAGFIDAFRGLLGTAPATNVVVTATASIPDVSSPQTAISGVLNIGVMKRRRLAAHASAGVARVDNGDPNLTVQLRGNYQFRFLDTYTINQSDNLSIRLTDGDNAFVGVFGGGFTYDFNARQGLKVNVRLHAGKSGMMTVVDAAPTSTAAAPVIVVPTITNPAAQFSNTTSGRSSLSGTTSRLTTFSSDGLETRVLFTAGYFFRF